MKLRRSLIEPSSTASPLPAVSVIVPHLNEPEKLAQCLRALDSQHADGIPFEIIVVDNGSRTMPETVCSAFDGVRLVREDAPGPGPARNHGAKLSRGYILAFIDADCLAASEWIKGIVTFLGAHSDIDFIGGDIQVAFAGRTADAVEAYEAAYCYRNRLYVEKHGYAATGNMAVRASVFEAVGPFGGINTMEDTEWGQRATAQGYRAAYAPDVCVSTPACRSYAELVRRYDRHIAHEYGEWPAGVTGTARWLMRSLVVAASPAVELFRLPRLAGVQDWRARLSAWLILTRLRLYRARRMVVMALRNDATQVIGRWNRDDAPTGRDSVEAAESL